MNKSIRIPAIAAVFLVGASLATASGSLAVGSPAPALKVAKWLKGAPIKSFEKGKVYVVEFWATWCGPCKVSIPHLTDMAKKYKGKATFTGVSVWEEKDPKDEKYIATVEKFVKDWGDKMNYNVAVDGKDGFMAQNWMTAAEQGGIPTAFVIDKTGSIAWIGHPMGDLDKVVGQVIDGTFDAKAEADRVAKLKEEADKRMGAIKPALDALRAGQFQDSVKAFDKAFGDDPKLEVQYGMAKLTALMGYDEAAGNLYASTLADGIYAENANALNAMAWNMVDDKSTMKKPDYKLAARIAQLGVDAAKDDMMKAYVLDTLAYAQFKGGEIDKAIASQEKAVALAKTIKDFDEATMKEMTDRLTLFKSKKG